MHDIKSIVVKYAVVEQRFLPGNVDSKRATFVEKYGFTKAHAQDLKLTGGSNCKRICSSSLSSANKTSLFKQN